MNSSEASLPPPVCVKVAQSCPSLWDPMACSLPGSFVHGILPARILEWVAIPWSRGSSQPIPWSSGSSQPRDWTQVSCTAGRFYTWATREALPPGLPVYIFIISSISRWTVYLLVLKKESSVPASLSLCSYNHRCFESWLSLPLHVPLEHLKHTQILQEYQSG